MGLIYVNPEVPEAPPFEEQGLGWRSGIEVT